MKHHFLTGLYLREQTLNVGEAVDTHTHNYDHWGVLVSGSATVITNGVAKEHTGPAVILIEKQIKHRIIAVSDIVWVCMHASSSTDVATIESEL